MREIKFRGKRVDNGEWVYGGVEQNSIAIIYDDTLPYDNENLVYKETVGQFTGLSDKNGKEIYEGDILDRRFYQRGYVVYENGAFRKALLGGIKSNNWKACPLSEVGLRDWQIIGNIHDNPELLKEQ